MSKISEEIFAELERVYPALAPLFRNATWEPIPKADGCSLEIYAAQSSDETALARKCLNGKIIFNFVCW